MRIFFAITLPKWARWATVDKFGVMECWAQEPMPITKFTTDPGRWMFGGRSKEVFQFSSQTFKRWRKSKYDLKSKRK